MDQILLFFCPKEKGCSPFKTTFAVHCRFRSMGSYCHRQYGPLPATNLGNQYILIIGDLFTNYIENAALPSIETTIITQVFLDKIVFRHGPPRRFLTDRGTKFTSKLIAQLCNDLNINKVFTSSYHPQCNGFVECINGVFMEIIAMYVASDHKDWDMYLPSATHAYNTSISATTCDTPFFLTYGREPVKLPDVALLQPLVRSNSVDYYPRAINSTDSNS